MSLSTRAPYEMVSGWIWGGLILDWLNGFFNRLAAVLAHSLLCLLGLWGLGGQFIMSKETFGIMLRVGRIQKDVKLFYGIMMLKKMLNLWSTHVNDLSKMEHFLRVWSGVGIRGCHISSPFGVATVHEVGGEGLSRGLCWKIC